jgi:hypothetical protein
LVLAREHLAEFPGDKDVGLAAEVARAAWERRRETYDPGR